MGLPAISGEEALVEDKKCYMQGTCLTEDKSNLSDSELFLSVMKNKEAQEIVLSIILNEPDLELKYVNVEEVIPNKKGKKAIRLDAYTEDTKGRIMDTEMQNDTSHDNIVKRARYYQSRVDSPVLKAGQKYPYKTLPSTIIIFITPRDLFGKKRACYRFTDRCTEFSELELGDGTEKIFVNMESQNGDPILVSLLQYMKDTRITNPEITVKDKRIQRLDQIVQEVKKSYEWREYVMSVEDWVRESVEKQIRESMEKQIRESVEKQVRYNAVRDGAKAFIGSYRRFHQTRETTRRAMISEYPMSENQADQYLDEFWKED